MIIDFSLIQLAVVGFFSGLGATFGGEVAKALIKKYHSTHKQLAKKLIE